MHMYFHHKKNQEYSLYDHAEEFNWLLQDAAKQKIALLWKTGTWI